MAGIEAEESVIPKLKPFFEPALPVAKSIPRPCQPPRSMPQRPHEQRLCCRVLAQRRRICQLRRGLRRALPRENCPQNTGRTWPGFTFSMACIIAPANSPTVGQWLSLIETMPIFRPAMTNSSFMLLSLDKAHRSLRPRRRREVFRSVRLAILVPRPSEYRMPSAAAPMAPEHYDPLEHASMGWRQLGLMGVVVGQNAFDLIERRPREILDYLFRR